MKIKLLTIVALVGIVLGGFSLPAHAAALFGASSFTTTAALLNGLVGHWTFDAWKMTSSAALDSSGQNSVAAQAGGVIRTPGVIGQGLRFNGVDGKLTTSGVSGVTGAGSRTVSVWFKTNAVSGNKGLVAFGSGATGQLFELLLLSNTVIGHFFGSGNDTITGAPTIVPGRWYNAVITYDGTVASVYLDGVFRNSKAVTLNTAASVVSIGDSIYLAASGFFNGSMDDVRIYNRALSQGEISTLYKLGVAQVALATQATSTGLGPVAYYPLDAPDIGSNGTVADRNRTGGVKNNGTLVSGPQKVTGQIGQALSFNGTSQYVSLGSFGQNVILPTFTYTAWVKPNSLSGRMEISNIHGNLFNIQAGLASVYISGVSSVYFQSPKVLIPNAWNFVATTWDGSTLSVSVNGVSTSTPFSGSAAGSSGVSTIGAQSYGALGSYFNGAIDEYRVYNRALSVKEIQDLYSQPRSQALNTNDTTKLTSGLVLNQTFNGTDIAGTAALDRSGNSNNGVLSNSPKPTPGKVGQALRFNGTTSFVNNPLSLSTASDFTVSAWLNPSSTSGTWRQVVDTRASGSNTPIRLGINNGTLVCRIEAGSVGNSFSVTLKASIPTNKWAHGACTLSGTTLSGYFDGVLVSSAVIAGSTSSTVLTIGKDPTSGSEEFAGSIDEVRVYSRALSAVEVASLYKLGQ